MRSACVERYDAVLAAPFAQLGVIADTQGIRRIVFLPLDQVVSINSAGNAAIAQLAAALTRFWDNPVMRFDLPLCYQGSVHQLQVWHALLAIAPGQTRSYGDIAAAIGSSPRAVGQACGANPLPIVIPCHRVVAKTGQGGFMHQRGGAALDYKNWLLSHESRFTTTD